jgi:hypothetical protein
MALPEGGGHAAAVLDLYGLTGGAARPVSATIHSLIIAGWTGRDAAAMEAHIEELAKLGIARPKTTPIFYRVAARLLTCATAIEVAGKDSSGEAEPVYFGIDGEMWVGVGSDHTDRKLETIGVTVSKQACAKPVGRELWLYADVANHWDELILRSYAHEGGQRHLYQEGPISRLRHPLDLVERYFGAGRSLPEGFAMYGGTIAVKGEIRPAEAFEIEIEDLRLRRSLRHRYDVHSLPVEG